MGELGSWLVRAREARGLTLEDAERDTRISRRYLQALESEQFEVIPAPVYARGFLRSYSQYLGLDPQEMLALFPSEDEPAPAPPGRAFGRQGQAEAGARPSMQTPAPAQSPARPAWGRRPKVEQPRSPNGPARPPRQAPPPEPQRPVQERPRPQRPPREEYQQQPLDPRLAPPPVHEPMIGVDIGVPVPARRLQQDPAAQTRNLTVVIVAVAAIIGVVLLALLISRLGGSDDPPAGGLAGTSGDETSEARATRTPQPTPSPQTVNATPGKVPDVIGLPADRARQAITAAGYKVSERRQNDATVPRNEVIQQAPAPDTELAEGQTVIILVSDGPG